MHLRRVLLGLTRPRVSRVVACIVRGGWKEGCVLSLKREGFLNNTTYRRAERLRDAGAPLRVALCLDSKIFFLYEFIPVTNRMLELLCNKRL